MIYLILGCVWGLIVGLGLFLSNDDDDRVSMSLISGAMFTFLGTLAAYLFTPVLGIVYSGFWLFVLAPLVITVFIIGIANVSELVIPKRSKVVTLSYVSLIGIYCVVAFIATAAIFHADDYHALLTVAEENQFDPDSVLLDQTQARFVDQSLAVRSANEILGKNRGMASRYSVGTMRIQNVNGELRWLAPFTHTSFRRWFDDSTSPGYVSVSANEYSDSQMNTDNMDINYGDDGFYLSTYVYRHVYANGYATTLIEDFSLEIDENGVPFWVGAIVEPQVGISGKIVTGVLTVNARSGSISEYTVDNAPIWIDRIQPEHIVEDLVSDWGEYANGWWDAFVGNEVVVPTKGSSIVFTKSDKASWYTGMRSNSSSNNESSMGFMLIDSRTGVALFYQRSGITEQVAEETIEGRVQEAGYESSAPIPYNIGGKTTFLSILKDKRNNVQGVGLIAYDNRSLVATGDNFSIAYRRYMSVLASNGENTINSGVDVTIIESTIERLYVQTVDNRLVLNFTLSHPDYNGVVFTASADNNKGAMLAHVGDSVVVEAMTIDGESSQVNEFINTELQYD